MKHSHLFNYIRIAASQYLIIAAIIIGLYGCKHNEISSSDITIDYPINNSIFPPEFPAPTFLWRDQSPETVLWKIKVSFTDGAEALTALSTGEKPHTGPIDSRCISVNNKLPQLTKQDSVSHSWKPDSALWLIIKKHSTGAAQSALITITGHSRSDTSAVLSQGHLTISTSSDSVGAPIFYRDVPLMPSETEKGVIKPLDVKAVPLISWRLRDIAKTESHVLMEGLHTCVNCHSFSSDGKRIGMDMDGPKNDKGLYAIVNVQPKMVVRTEDQVAWSTFRGRLGSKLRVGFMSQLSPDGRYVITSVNDPGIDQSDVERMRNPKDLVRNYYIANFTDYRFLQVFYPTRGVLAWYSSQSGHLNYLPGADDSMYVHANAVWSPDGKYLVFARAKARDPYPENGKRAQYANDSNETPIKYDLYRIPFNDGKGGQPEPIEGASHNGMSNSFPKISPDGRWIIFVQAKNGLLMRPDGQLYIVPAGGGTARRMNCNTPLMNSWHSFSPNGHWLVFSSKSRSPYTQLFLTHLDSSGHDSPAILIENSTAANRAANIPEFVNIPVNGIDHIETPAAQYAQHADLAIEAVKNNNYPEAVREWDTVLTLAPKDPWVFNNLGFALMGCGKIDEAITWYKKALSVQPDYVEALNNYGEALSGKGDLPGAIALFEKAVATDTDAAVSRANLGLVLASTGQTDKAILHLTRAVSLSPDNLNIRKTLGHALADKGKYQEACVQLETAIMLSGSKDYFTLYLLGKVYFELGRRTDALAILQQAHAAAQEQNDTELLHAIDEYLQKK